MEGTELSHGSTGSLCSAVLLGKLTGTFKLCFVSCIALPFPNPPNFAMTFHVLVQ